MHFKVFSFIAAVALLSIESSLGSGFEDDHPGRRRVPNNNNEPARPMAATIGIDDLPQDQRVELNEIVPLDSRRARLLQMVNNCPLEKRKSYLPVLLYIIKNTPDSHKASIADILCTYNSLTREEAVQLMQELYTNSFMDGQNRIDYAISFVRRVVLPRIAVDPARHTVELSIYALSLEQSTELMAMVPEVTWRRLLHMGNNCLFEKRDSYIANLLQIIRETPESHREPIVAALCKYDNLTWEETEHLKSILSSVSKSDGRLRVIRVSTTVYEIVSSRLRREKKAREAEQLHQGALDTLQVDRALRESRGEALPEQYLWDIFPADPNFSPEIDGVFISPLVCCAKFMNDFPGLDTHSGLMLIECSIRGKLSRLHEQISEIDAKIGLTSGEDKQKWQRQRGNLAAKKSFWKKQWNNIDDLRKNWNTFVPWFLNDLTEMLSLPYLQKHLGEVLWENEGVDVTYNEGLFVSRYIYEFLYRFSTLTPEQQAYSLLEWKYNILPNIKEICAWIKEIDEEDLSRGKESYSKLMNEAFEGYLGNDKAIPIRINAFREPVINARKYLLKYLTMLLTYTQDFKSREVNDMCLIKINLDEECRRFDSIVVNFDGGYTYIHPDCCAFSWVESYNAVSLIEAQRNFILSFLDCYKDFRDAGLLEHFYNKVVMDGNCLNARAANFTDARMNLLPSLIREARGRAPLVVPMDGSVIPEGPAVIVAGVLKEMMDDAVVAGLEDVSIEDVDLHNILINFFKIGQPNAVRGTTGEVTIEILKAEIRKLVEVNDLPGMNITGIQANVYNWAKQKE